MKFITLYLIVARLLCAQCEAQTLLEPSGEEIHPLSINVVSYRNGVGLDQDIDILVRELTNLGHVVHEVDYRNKKKRDQVDVNIFIELVNEKMFKYASKNYFMPNPDWCFNGPETISKFDKILCKTRETLRIFEPLNPNSVFMGFTCDDRYDPLITKNFQSALHLAGASVQKNTEEVILAWGQNPHFPPLSLIKHQHLRKDPKLNNLNFIYRYLTRDEIVFNQNYHGLHICPSGMEGFGYYIMEGLSCGAVVLTLDAPPMNEFVKDKRCLVKPSGGVPHKLATMYSVKPEDLAEVIENILALPEEELVEIGRKNREFYLENDRLFKERLAEIFLSTGL